MRDDGLELHGNMSEFWILNNFVRYFLVVICLFYYNQYEEADTSNYPSKKDKLASCADKTTLKRCRDGTGKATVSYQRGRPLRPRGMLVALAKLYKLFPSLYGCLC